MKLTTCSLLLSSCFAFAGNVYSQGVKVSLNKNKVQLEDVLDEIENQTDYLFISNRDVNLKQKVSVRAKNESVEEVLSDILKNTGLTFKVEGVNIILSRKEEIVQQQVKTITGTIVDSNGEPIIGANIVEKGTTNGTITDMDGKFSLNISSGATLTISYIGFVAQEVKVGNQRSINITLREDTETLEEIVVVGYGTQKRGNLTGSVASIKSEKLTVAPIANVSNSLGGQVPGVISRQASGEPGKDGASISIRGFGSSLVIVDGVESSMSNLDPNEIESVSVLKDASAAIYGARAGNGVILVTTKRGKIGKPTISLNSTMSWQSVTQFPNVMNAAQFSEIIREAQLNSGTPENGMMFSEEDVRKYREGTEPGYQGWNWWDAIIKDYAPMQQHNVSLNGGNEQFKYTAFLGYTNQAGMYRSRDNKMKRYNMRANLDGNINKYLSVQFNMSEIITDTKSPSRDQGSLWRDIFGALPTLRPILPDRSKIGWSGGITSPIAGTDSNLGGYKNGLNNQLYMTLSSTYKLPWVQGLSVKGLLNYNQTTQENKSWTKGYSMYLYDEGGDKYIEKPGASTTSLSESYSRSKTITGQISVNYEREFAEKHNISAIALVELIDYYSKWFNAGRSGYITDAIDQIFAGGADRQSANGSASESGRISYVGRVNYSFMSKYLAEITMRYDGSPKFASDKRWGFFPSVSLGWRMSEENFIKNNVDFLDNLKLRVSYSKSGYDAIGAFQYLTGYKYGNLYIVDHAERNSLVSTGLSNPYITWEKMKLYNVGLDYSFFNGKLYGEMDFFYRDRYDILGNRVASMPNTFGANLPPENINSMTNRGVEILLGHKSNYNGLTVDVSGNITWTRAKWNHYDEPEYTDPDDLRINKVSGNWANRTFGYKSDGLFTSQDEIDNYKLNQDLQGNKTLQPGDIKYVDLNGDNVLDWRDKMEIGKSSDPELMFGLNFALSYKNFDLSGLFQGAARRSMSIKTGLEDLSNNNSLIYEKRWNESNNDKWAIIPRQYVGGKTNNNHTSDYWLKNASYLRLKTLSIGYSIPSSLLKKIMVQRLRVYVATTNLFTISGLNKYNVDPEGQGVGNYYPQQKTFSVGLNLNF